MAGFRGRPSNKRPVVEPIRKKCYNCGKIRLVKHKKTILPTAGSQWKIPIYNKNATKKNRVDLPGVVIEYYCSVECGGVAQPSKVLQ